MSGGKVIQRKPVRHLPPDASTERRVEAINSLMEWSADLDYHQQQHEDECSQFRREVRGENKTRDARLERIETTVAHNSKLLWAILGIILGAIGYLVRESL